MPVDNDVSEELLDALSLSGKKVRVQLDFEASDIRTLNAMVRRLKLGSRAELIRSGLRALRWMAEKKGQNCSIVAITPDGRYIEPEFDFLETVDGGVVVDDTQVTAARVHHA